MLNLAAIERAIISIESVSRSETTIDVGDLQVSLRPLSGREEVDVVEFAMAALGDGAAGQTRAQMVDFYFRSQVRTLAHALVRVGEVDLHGETVETEEILDGVAVKRSKVDVMGEYIDKHWSKMVVQKMFVCAVNALEAATTKTVDTIRSNPFDYGAEIDRLEARVKDLKTSQDQIKASQQQEGWVESMKTSSLEYAKAAVEVPTLQPEDLPQAPPPQAPPQSPLQSQPPQPQPPQPQSQPLQPRAPHFPVAPMPERADPVPASPPIHSSFLDEGNPEASMAEEAQRQAEILRRGRLEGLRQAKNTQQVVLDPKGSSLDVNPPRTGWGQGAGGDVVMSTDGPMEISERTKTVGGAQPLLNTPPRNPAPTNPRFRPR